MSSKPLLFLRTRFWGTETYQHTWPLDARTATSLLLCILLLSLVGWLYLTQAGQMASLGHQMQRMVMDMEKLERENALLRYKIAELETLPRIEARARQLGLGPVKRVRYLLVPLSTPQPILFEVPPTSSGGDVSKLPSETGPFFSNIEQFFSNIQAELATWVSKL